MDYILWLEVGLFVCMMVFSGFFSSSETALFSLSNTQLEQMRRDQHPRFPLIQRLLSQPRRLIITILIGNELVNVTASVISAAVVIRMLGAENKWINLLIMVPLQIHRSLCPSDPAHPLGGPLCGRPFYYPHHR